MRAVQKGERRPTSSVFKSIESLSRFDDRCFDPFRALVFSRIKHVYVSDVAFVDYSRYCMIASCFENRARSSWIVNFSSNVFLSFQRSLKRLIKKIWFFNRFMSICVHWENSSLLKNLDFSILDVHSIDNCKCKNCIKCVIWI